MYQAAIACQQTNEFHLYLHTIIFSDEFAENKEDLVFYDEINWNLWAGTYSCVK